MLVFSRFLYLLVFVCLFSTSCMTMKKLAIKKTLERARDSTASQVKYTPPPTSYVKKKRANLDAFWFNKKNKSSISYFSNCSKENSYLTLKDVEQDVLSHVSYSKIVKTAASSRYRYSVIRTKKYNTINGVYTLKPNACFFIFNLISPSLPVFEQEEKTFKKFIEGFKAL